MIFFQNITQYIYQLQYVIIIWLLRDLLGQARGQEPIKFIALMCVLICGKRGAVCGKRLTLLRNSSYEQVKYYVWCRHQFLKSVKKNILFFYDYIRD